MLLNETSVYPATESFNFNAREQLISAKGNIAGELSLITPLAFANNEQRRLVRSNDTLNDAKPGFSHLFTYFLV